MAPVKSRLASDRRSVTINFSGSTDCATDEIHWCDRGVTLRTKWPFHEGTEIEFGMEVGRKRHCCCGVVVHCETLGSPGLYVVTLFFIETPCVEIQRAARCLCGREMSPKVAG